MTNPDDELRALRATCAELRDEVATLRAIDSGDRDAWAWRLLGKIDRQRAANDILNRRVTSQRFVLRTLKDLGRDLSRDEYLEAREREVEANPLLANRIDEQPEAA